jgi:hypothetical protein
LGLTLRDPITLGHVLLLDEMGSPVLKGGEVFIGDVALAAFACAWPADVSRRKIRSPFTKLAFRVWSRLWKVDSSAQDFGQWFNAQLALPKQWQQAGDPKHPARELAAPWWINRIAQAMSAGFSYSEAVNLPVKTVSIVVAAKLEASGAVEFVSERQDEFLKLAEQWAAEGRKA